jgi:hypothetical protein
MHSSDAGLAEGFLMHEDFSRQEDIKPHRTSLAYCLNEGGITLSGLRSFRMAIPL